MLHQTEKIKLFKLEIFEHTHYWYSSKGFSLIFDWDNFLYEKIRRDHYRLQPDCFKKIVSKNFVSEKKLNRYLKDLGFKRGVIFERNLEDCIKGYSCSYRKNINQYFFIIRDLYSEKKYIFKSSN